MIGNLIKRQYQNVSLLGAYTIFDFMKQAFLFPVDYYLRSGRSSFPINITLALTLRCNAKCAMCALTELLNNRDEELSLEQYRIFIESCVKFRPGFVLYGGEPFLRNDILDIIEIIKKHKLSCGVFTNGILLNKNILKEIIRLQLNFVVFSVYGPRDIHDRIVGINGAYDKLIENMAFLKEQRAKTSIIIHCTVSEQNIRYLDKLADISQYDKVRFGHLTFFTDADKKKAAEELKYLFPQDRIELKSFILNPDKILTEQFIDNLFIVKAKKEASFTPELDIDEIKNWYSCDFKTRRKCIFVWRGVFIAPNGDVYPCMGNFYYRMGNILKDNLLDIWNSEKYIAFRSMLRKRIFSACARCCRL